jgi:hypothetical protein
MPGESYEGAVCYVGFDHEAADGRALLGGNHYSAAVGPDGGDVPGERLFLDDDGVYHVAEDADPSYRDRHPDHLVIAAVMGGVGEPRTDAEYEATYRHLDALEERLASDGVHEQEHDHICQTVEEVHVVRMWLQQADARRDKS